MSAEDFQGNWEQLDDLFEQAVALPHEEVAQFCMDVCDGDEEMRSFLYDLVTAAEIEDQHIRGSISTLAQQVASDSVLTGRRVGAYHVDELIARGGMGEVYLASRADGEFEMKVAIKVLRKRLNRASFVEHFKNERQVLANLKHASIPALVDAGQLKDGRPYFVGEYVDGVSVDVYCDSERLSDRERVQLIERIGRAVQHAHNTLVLHLDIKPDNILIEKDGTPRLLDFGIARLMEDSVSGQDAFTPQYASPEQLRGDTPTAASDIYALGVLLFRLLSGALPFTEQRFADRQTKIADRVKVSTRIEQPAALPRNDRDLRAIVKKAMAEAVADRYTSVEAFLRDLKNWRHHLPVSARKITVPYRLGRFSRRNRVGLAFVVSMFALLAAFGVREFQLRKQAQESSLKAEREAETLRRVSTFLTELFEVSDPGQARGNSVTARELLDKGAERIGEELADQPQIATRMMRTMGNVYNKLGLYEQAAPLLENALALREAQSDGEDAGVAQLLDDIGNTYRYLARFEEAEPKLLRGLAIREKVLGPEHVNVADSLRALGNLYMREGLEEKAEAYHLRGIPIHEKALGGDHPEYAMHLSSLAMVYSDQGRFDEAEELYLRAIAILEQAWGEDHPDLSKYFASLGNLYTSADRNENARAYLLRAFELQQSSLEPNHPLLAYSLINLATLDENLGALDAAEKKLFQAIAILEQNFEPDDYRIGLCRYNLASVYSKRGELDKALAFGLQAEEVLGAALDSGHMYLGYVTLLVGKVYLELGDADQAEPYLVRAWRIFGARPRGDSLRDRAATAYGAYLRAAGREADALALEQDAGP